MYIANTRPLPLAFPLKKFTYPEINLKYRHHLHLVGHNYRTYLSPFTLHPSQSHFALLVLRFNTLSLTTASPQFKLMMAWTYQQIEVLSIHLHEAFQVLT